MDPRVKPEDDEPTVPAHPTGATAPRSVLSDISHGRLANGLGPNLDRNQAVPAIARRRPLGLTVKGIGVTCIRYN